MAVIDTHVRANVQFYKFGCPLRLECFSKSGSMVCDFDLCLAITKGRAVHLATTYSVGS
jgi:hypothetical protein